MKRYNGYSPPLSLSRAWSHLRVCTQSLRDIKGAFPQDSVSIGPLLPPFPGRVGLRAGSTNKNPPIRIAEGSVLPCVRSRWVSFLRREEGASLLPEDPGVWGGTNIPLHLWVSTAHASLHWMQHGERGSAPETGRGASRDLDARISLLPLPCHALLEGLAKLSAI